MKSLKRDLTRLTVDIPYKLKFYNDKTDSITENLEGHVLYLDIYVGNILYENIYICINDFYPFKAPKVFLGFYFKHPNIINEDGEFCFTDWGPIITLNQLIWHIYLTLTETEE
jgi:ubiquitin-protein ligase